MPFETSYTCSDCGFSFKRKTERDPRIAGGRLPSCPECRKGKYSAIKSIAKSNITLPQAELDRRHREIVESRQAPSAGKSAFTKAMDETANIVMQDYGLTDLKDNLRAGDSMVPSLQGKDTNGVPLEQRVQNAFAPQKNNVMGMAGQQLNGALMRQINAGAFRNQADPVARQQNSGYMPPTRIIHKHQREQ